MLRTDGRAQLETVISPIAAKYLERAIYNKAIERASWLGVEAQWDVPGFSEWYAQEIQAALFHAPIWSDRWNADPKRAAVEWVSGDPVMRHPSAWKEIQVEDREGAEPCRKCKSKTTTYTAVQLRSSDEPMTLLFRCKTCNHRWNM